MTRYIDLSHDFADGMPGFTTALPDGSRLRCTARIRPLITHVRSRSWLLARDIFIVENLRNLAALGAAQFRFFAVPIKARGAASTPLRAFAEVT